MSNYDYLVVGSGLFGAIFAHEAAKKGKKLKLLKNVIILQGISILKK